MCEGRGGRGGKSGAQMSPIWRGEKDEVGAGGGSVRTGRERDAADDKEAMVREIVVGCRDMILCWECFVMGRQL